MSEEMRANDDHAQMTTQGKPEQPTKLPGLGRGKPLPESNNTEQPPPPSSLSSQTTASKWNSDKGSSFGSTSFGRNNENNDSNGSGGFNSRNTDGFANRGRPEFSGQSSSGQAGNPRTCYNCNKSGHISRDCHEPPNENRNGRGGHRGGGFNSGSRGGGFNSGKREGGFNSGNRGGGFNSGNREGGFDSSNRGGGFNSGNREGGFDSSNREGGFNAGNRGGGFRGNRDAGGGGFHSGGDRDNRNDAGGSGNTESRDSNRNDQQRESSSRVFSSGGDRRDRPPNDNSNPGSGPQRPERYVPPPVPTDVGDIFGEALSKGENFDKYHRANVKCTPEGKVHAIEFYEEANLATGILENIRRAHFEEPTHIQRYAIPCIQQQDDLVACAQTGSGKTAAFLLPIISNLLEYHANDLPQKHQPPSPLCLIVSPTRELALQTEREARKFAYKTDIIPCSAIGGHDMYAVSDRLREGCHILSGTTGRLKDMAEKGRISLKKVKYFVLDEADRMLDTGFEPDIRKLEDLGLPPKGERYTFMFSATFPAAVQELAKHFLRENYVFLSVGTPGGANEDISQTIEEVPQAQKKSRLLELLEQNLKSERCLIFVETKRSADYIGSLLSQKELMSTTMHGDRTQRQRYEAVQDFTRGTCRILVATSVAARGLDFPLIGYVINFDLPDSSDFYIHRIGRTGRAGHLGKSISFFDPQRESDRKIAPDLITRLVEAGQSVPEFLQQYAANEFQPNAPNSHPVDMRHHPNDYNNRHRQTTGPTGGSASAGAAHARENWD